MITLWEIPVIQRIQNAENEVQIVLELIAPSEIARVSPTKNGVVIWLKGGIPYIECPMTYQQFVSQLQNLKDKNDEPRIKESDARD